MTVHQLPKRKKRLLFIALIALGILLVARVIMPYLVLHYANRWLANMKGYYGHVETIDLALIRGAYKLDHIYLNKVDEKTQKQTKFFEASLIDLSLEWRALFHGSIVGKLAFDNPELRFTKDRVEPKTLRKDSAHFKKMLEVFMPLDIDRFDVNNGQIRYIDPNSKPKVDISLTHVHILASNLRNSYDSTVLLPASVRAQADLYGGKLTFNMKLNPLELEPTFDLNAELIKTSLPELNEFFDAYANVKVSGGSFGLYTEVAAKDGYFKGYVKPVIKDLKVIGNANRDDSVLKKIWEGFVGTVADLLTNHKKDQLATKIPFDGKLKEPNTNIWYSILHVLENAFVRAIVPAIDNEINITSVDPKAAKKKSFLEKLFTPSKKEKKGN